MKKLLIASLIMIVGLFFEYQAIADIYTWVDENGVLHISDVPPTSEKNVEIIETHNEPLTSQKPPHAKPQIENRFNHKKIPKEKVYIKKKGQGNYNTKVEIFTTSWCRYCKKAITFLRSNRVKYMQYDIEKDRKAAAKMKALGGRGGVPFAIINGNPITGFSAAAYKQLLGLP